MIRSLALRPQRRHTAVQGAPSRIALRCSRRLTRTVSGKLAKKKDEQLYLPLHNPKTFSDSLEPRAEPADPKARSGI